MGLFDWLSGKKKPRPAATPQEQLQQLRGSGQVVLVYLRPLEWGGIDGPPNITWLPPAAPREKQEFEDQVAAEVSKGASLGYACDLEYEGDSLLPSKVKLEAIGPAV